MIGTSSSERPDDAAAGKTENRPRKSLDDHVVLQDHPLNLTSGCPERHVHRSRASGQPRATECRRVHREHESQRAQRDGGLTCRSGDLEWTGENRAARADDLGRKVRVGAAEHARERADCGRRVAGASDHGQERSRMLREWPVENGAGSPSIRRTSVSCATPMIVTRDCEDARLPTMTAGRLRRRPEHLPGGELAQDRNGRSARAIAIIEPAPAEDVHAECVEDFRRHPDGPDGTTTGPLSPVIPGMTTGRRDVCDAERRLVETASA